MILKGRSFYEKSLPSDTLHFGFSATAMHWLSRLPCTLSSHIHPVGASEAERVIFEQQARQDWETILTLRVLEVCFQVMVCLMD